MAIVHFFFTPCTYVSPQVHLLAICLTASDYDQIDIQVTCHPKPTIDSNNLLLILDGEWILYFLEPYLELCGWVPFEWFQQLTESNNELWCSTLVFRRIQKLIWISLYKILWICLDALNFFLPVLRQHHRLVHLYCTIIRETNSALSGLHETWSDGFTLTFLDSPVVQSSSWRFPGEWHLLHNWKKVWQSTDGPLLVDAKSNHYWLWFSMAVH